MWSPTHVQVTVHRARGLISKGKNGTNDAFVTIALGKSKYRTSVKDKSSDMVVEWHEECELPIPKQGNTAQIILTALHRNLIGVADEFLGVVSIQLSDLDVYERPKNRWYKLGSKPGKENTKERGELEVKVAFVVKSGMLEESSKKEKHKASLGQLSHMAQSVGGSLLSIGSLEKRKSLKTFAKSIGHKVVKGKKKLTGGKGSSVDGSMEGSQDWSPQEVVGMKSGQVLGEADPGVISEGESDDDFALDDLSHKSSASSLNASQGGTGGQPANMLENLAGGEFLRRNSNVPPSKPPRTSNVPEKDEWQEKLFGRHGKDHVMDPLKRRSWDSPKSTLLSQPEEEEAPKGHKVEEVGVGQEVLSPPKTAASPLKPPEDVVEILGKREDEKEISKFARKFKNFRRESKFTDLFSENKPPVDHNDTPAERIIIGDEAKGVSPKSNHRLPLEILQKYEGKSREDLIEMIMNLQSSLSRQELRMHDLEDYLDNLLVRVMETTPRILQTPYLTNLKAATWRGFR
ncbi:rab11 family-interacting protein 2 [Hetaerina americana]|uniref:rab11 family-interacting protein 2 n=1 Tax=Hetaerina americana TaxID=62018 RepID=UPI003A7F326B